MPFYRQAQPEGQARLHLRVRRTNAAGTYVLMIAASNAAHQVTAFKPPIVNPHSLNSLSNCAPRASFVQRRHCSSSVSQSLGPSYHVDKGRADARSRCCTHPSQWRRPQEMASQDAEHFYYRALIPDVDTSAMECLRT